MNMAEKKVLHKDLVKAGLIGLLVVLLVIVAADYYVEKNFGGDGTKLLDKFGGRSLQTYAAAYFVGATILPLPIGILYATMLRYYPDAGIVILVTFIAGTLGSLFNYFFAGWVRTAVLERIVSRKSLESAKEWIDQYGPASFIILGFSGVPLYDPLTAVAGAAKMEFKQFLLYSIIGRIGHLLLYAGIIRIV